MWFENCLINDKNSLLNSQRHLLVEIIKQMSTKRFLFVNRTSMSCFKIIWFFYIGEIKFKSSLMLIPPDIWIKNTRPICYTMWINVIMTFFTTPQRATEKKNIAMLTKARKTIAKAIPTIAPAGIELTATGSSWLRFSFVELSNASANRRYGG